MATFEASPVSAPVFLVAALAAAGAVHAQTFPARPLELVVHTGPGGGTDSFARAVADIIMREKLLPQPVTVSNRSGGSGAVAYNYIKTKRGDPHVVLTVASGTFTTALARPEQGYGLEQFTPLAFVAMDAQAIAVGAQTPYATVRELIEAGRREPNQISASVASATGTGRLLLFLIERETGAKFKFVPFKSGADAAMSVLGGHVPFTTENLSEMYPQVEAKKIRVLAVTGERRLRIVPDVPTLKELGYKIVVGTGRGFALPAGVPPEALATMEDVMKKMHASPLWREFSARMMYEDTYLPSAEFTQYLEARRAEMVDFLTAVGLIQK